MTVSIYRYPTQIPFAAGIRPRSIYDLESEFDEYGNELFVESRDKKTRKREVWYRICQRSGRVRHCTRSFYGTNSETVSDDHWLPRREHWEQLSQHSRKSARRGGSSVRKNPKKQ